MIIFFLLQTFIFWPLQYKVSLALFCRYDRTYYEWLLLLMADVLPLQPVRRPGSMRQTWREKATRSSWQTWGRCTGHGFAPTLWTWRLGPFPESSHNTAATLSTRNKETLTTVLAGRGNDWFINIFLSLVMGDIDLNLVSWEIDAASERNIKLKYKLYWRCDAVGGYFTVTAHRRVFYASTRNRSRNSVKITKWSSPVQDIFVQVSATISTTCVHWMPLLSSQHTNVKKMHLFFHKPTSFYSFLCSRMSDSVV